MAATKVQSALKEYRAKRNFGRTPEPTGTPRKRPAAHAALSFVVQKHAASHLHYDFRLELDGVLKSWAVPKGPSLDPAQKRLAVQVEDHPLEYGSFEGTIPEGEYGGGTVMLWDQGTWELAEGDDPDAALRAGKLKIQLKGRKLKGGWSLVRMRRSNGKPQWLLIKEADKFARPDGEFNITEEKPRSVVSKRDMDQIAGAKRAKVWSSGRARRTARKAKATPDVAVDSRGEVKRQRTHTKSRRVLIDEALPGAVRARQPAAIPFSLATLVDDIPAGDGWLHEVKFDGYRIMAHLDRGDVRLMARGGGDWSSKFPEIAAALESPGPLNGILDGEIVALNDEGVSSFGALQTALKTGHRQGLQLFLFDVPFWDGWDLRDCALQDRRRILEAILKTEFKRSPKIKFSEAIQGKGKQLITQACRLHLEGIISKRLDSPYQGRRTGDWTKCKCGNRQEFVIGGYTDPRRTRKGFGSLLLGYFTDGRLTYSGRVGAGFDDWMLTELSGRLRALETDEPPFDPLPPRADIGAYAHWVKPDLIAEVSFTEWTSDGRLRHPVFLGLREDKQAADIVRERAAPAPMPRRRSMPARDKGKVTRSRPAPNLAEGPEVAGVAISNPDRVVYSHMEITKLQVARYYEAVADRILPHLENRPLSIVRCPDGAGGQCFFQKHMDISSLRGLNTVQIRESKGQAPYVLVRDVSGLISLVQMNVLEMHIWGARADDPDLPDRMIFDLDPGPNVGWKQIAAGAHAVRALLEALGLQSFLKTSGGKGLHVVAPIRRGPDWDTVKLACRRVAENLAQADPDSFTSVMSKDRRVGKVFVDYLRNSRGATSVSPYSTRARPGATMSMPIPWTAVETVDPAAFHITDAPDLLSGRKDPWDGFFGLRQSLTAAAIRTLATGSLAPAPPASRSRSPGRTAGARSAKSSRSRSERRSPSPSSRAGRTS